MPFDSICYSGAIKCFVYPSANRTLLLQERTGHLGAQSVETHVYFPVRAFSFVLSAILISQLGCRCILVPRLSLAVLRSPFPVPRSISGVPVPGISNILHKERRTKETNNQTTNESLPTFVQMDNASTSIKRPFSLLILLVLVLVSMFRMSVQF